MFPNGTVLLLLRRPAPLPPSPSPPTPGPSVPTPMPPTRPVRRRRLAGCAKPIRTTLRALSKKSLLTSQGLEFLMEILDSEGLFWEVLDGFQGSTEPLEASPGVPWAPGRLKKPWGEPPVSYSTAFLRIKWGVVSQLRGPRRGRRPPVLGLQRLRPVRRPGGPRRGALPRCGLHPATSLRNSLLPSEALEFL